MTNLNFYHYPELVKLLNVLNGITNPLHPKSVTDGVNFVGNDLFDCIAIQMRTNF